MVEEKYGTVHCRGIFGLRLDTEGGIQRYIAESKIDRYKGVVQTVADTVVSL